MCSNLIGYSVYIYAQIDYVHLTDLYLNLLDSLHIPRSALLELYGLSLGRHQALRLPSGMAAIGATLAAVANSRSKVGRAGAWELRGAKMGIFMGCNHEKKIFNMI